MWISLGSCSESARRYEPQWVVYEGQHGANAIAHFFDLTQANDYAEMRNKIERNKPKVSHQAKP